MAYTLQALIGEVGSFGRIESEAPIVLLEQGFEMVLFTSEFLQRNEFESLPLTDGGCGIFPENIKNYCLKVSGGNAVAYVEAEYFGGTGMQGSVVLEGAASEPNPVIDGKAINMALRHIGVVEKVPFDEFVSIGLAKYNHTDVWQETKRL